MAGTLRFARPTDALRAARAGTLPPGLRGRAGEGENAAGPGALIRRKAQGARL